LLDTTIFSHSAGLEIITGGGGFMLEREEELLNSKQVAVILDVSPDTVNEFARKNILPAFKKGKQWRFRRRDISVFFKKQNRDIRDA
jgi:excisionase family DNA binding protein